MIKLIFAHFLGRNPPQIFFAIKDINNRFTYRFFFHRDTSNRTRRSQNGRRSSPRAAPPRCVASRLLYGRYTESSLTCNRNRRRRTCHSRIVAYPLARINDVTNCTFNRDMHFFRRARWKPRDSARRRAPKSHKDRKIRGCPV